jgi:hypothetical protein
MRVLIVFAVLTLLPAPQPAPPRVPILVELFTSEGCSSCPPADALLTSLSAQQPVGGAEIIALGLHVDYWDRLGWKDQGSLHEATLRQEAYARMFGSDTIYTPEAVVDGWSGLVGSDAGAVRRAVERAAARPHARVAVNAALDGDALSANASATSIPDDVKEPVEMFIALVEDGVMSHVTGGENRGRELRHAAVVRALSTAKGASGQARFTLKPAWNRARLRVVAFLQGRRSEHVFGSAAAAPLS